MTATGKANAMWKGGRSVASNGYVLIRVGKDHHLADVRGYAYEHRLVAEQKLGRRLLPGEEAHHKNDNKADNSPDNIEVLTRHRHRVKHRKHENSDGWWREPDEPNPMITCRCGCGSRFRTFDQQGRRRVYKHGHNP